MGTTQEIEITRDNSPSTSRMILSFGDAPQAWISRQFTGEANNYRVLHRTSIGIGARGGLAHGPALEHLSFLFSRGEDEVDKRKTVSTINLHIALAGVGRVSRQSTIKCNAPQGSIRNGAMSSGYGLHGFEGRYEFRSVVEMFLWKVRHSVT
jgi:hypothetical protein